MSATDTWRDLTKWPRLLVVGDRVTEDQAAEIIVRTTGWSLFSNDREWLGIVAAEAGLAVDEHGWVDYKDAERLEVEVRCLPLEYLTNGRVCSAWIGGPKGWIDWDGRVGCSTWNIGKYPTHEEVEGELREIASAWRFLSMQVQLVANEGEGPLAAAWSVEGGNVEPEPVGPDVAKIRPVDEVGMPAMLSRLTSPYGERGCTVEQLRRGLALAREAAIGMIDDGEDPIAEDGDR